MPNGPRSRIFQLPASDHPHYTAEAHPTYLETTPQSSVPTVGGGRQPFPRVDSYLLNNPIRPSTCTRVNIKLVTFEGYSYTIIMMNLWFYLIKIRRANSAAD
ncbi:hypothetical protein ALC53_13524 [Atta colombica]|uniref:Uncharacterized protein n=1 Tax=Atta colombica TaxID=520822 RepID=A0A195AVP2_9HYME|nr:hypothetical protein ALC53_13524 [Atta colombica]